MKFLRDNGLVELSAREVALREVPTKRKMASCWLSDKGRKVLELSKSVDVDLLRITPKQLECLRLLEGEEKHLSDVPEDVQATLQNLIDRGLVEKRVAEEETKRKVYGKKHIYTITEKGLKAYKALKTIQAL
jgi:DNA-binding MarR family transcriptional regulator